jgi:hypothetical protein
MATFSDGATSVNIFLNIFQANGIAPHYPDLTGFSGVQTSAKWLESVLF